jgi:hypothetical protein
VLHSLSATTILADLTPKYLAVASLAALVKYVENMQHIVLAEKSVEVLLKEPEGRMVSITQWQFFRRRVHVDVLSDTAGD